MPVFIDQGFLFNEYLSKTVKITAKTPHTVKLAIKRDGCYFGDSVGSYANKVLVLLTF